MNFWRLIVFIIELKENLWMSLNHYFIIIIIENCTGRTFDVFTRWEHVILHFNHFIVGLEQLTKLTFVVKWIARINW